MQITAAQSAAPSHSREWFTLHDDGVVYRLQNTGDHTAKYERVAYGCSAAVANEIAALPELLAALRATVDAHRALFDADLFNERMTKAHRMALAAIAKAEGRAA